MTWIDYFTMSANVGRSVTESHKVWLAAAAIGLLFVWRLLRERAPRAAFSLLLTLCLLSTANYLRWGWESSATRVDAYDVIHYYLNAKYFDELGYLDLYPAVIVADHENEGPFYKEGNRYLAQDEDKGHFVAPISHAMSRGEWVKRERFSPARWRAFSHDVLYLQRTIGCRVRDRKKRCRQEFNDGLWRQMIQDHGFNGTPAWTLIAEPFTWIPVESIKWLGYLDVVLLVGAFVAIGFAYGGTTALWGWLFFVLCYSLRWPTVTWVFLRYDWIAALLFALAAIKKGHYFLAGLLSGWAATLRFFPAFWMWGPLSKGLVGLTERIIRKPLLVLALGWLVSVAVLQVGAAVRFGPDQILVHFENMLDHNRAEQLSSRRIGLAVGLAFGGPLEESIPKVIGRERKKRIGAQRYLRYGVGMLFLVVMGWGLRRADDDEAFAYGFIPIFLLTTMSYYYYIARITLAVIHASDLRKNRNLFGLVWLFGLELFSNWAQSSYKGHRLFLIGYLSWGLAVYSLVMMAFFLLSTSPKDLETSRRTSRRPTQDHEG